MFCKALAYQALCFDTNVTQKHGDVLLGSPRFTPEHPSLKSRTRPAIGSKTCQGVETKIEIDTPQKYLSTSDHGLLQIFQIFDFHPPFTDSTNRIASFSITLSVDFPLFLGSRTIKRHILLRLQAIECLHVLLYWWRHSQCSPCHPTARHDQDGGKLCLARTTIALSSHDSCSQDKVVHTC